MCWRDDVPMHRWCSMCGQRYYGDLGHRFCSKRTAAPQPTPPADHSLDRWADDGGVPVPIPHPLPAQANDGGEQP